MIEAEDVLKSTRVPGTKLFLLGCLDSRVTVLSQQRRALNLTDAVLGAKDLVRPNGRIAIVGGGAAGVTAAAAFALAAPGLSRIDLFERESELLHLQRHSDRDLHPFIYDWPATEEAADVDAGLPLLNWQAGVAKEVARQIIAGFGLIRKQSSNLFVHCSATAKSVEATDVWCRLHVDGRTADGGTYDAVILAIGYGYERRSNTNRFDSYWTPSQLLGPAGDKPVIFISGNGDGGLVDFTMAAFDRMTHEAIIDFVVNHPRSASFKEELIEIERLAWASDDGTFDILARYRQMNLPSDLLMDVNDRLRDAEIYFHTRERQIFRKKSAVLNRFTAFLAIQTDESFKRGKIHVVPNVQHRELPNGDISLGSETIRPTIPIFRFGPERDANMQPFKKWREIFNAANPEEPAVYHPALPLLTSTALTRFGRLPPVADIAVDPPPAPPPVDPRQSLAERGIQINAQSLGQFIESGVEDAVAWLLQAGVSPNTLLEGVEPIELALRQLKGSSESESRADASASTELDPSRVAVLRALVTAKPRSLGHVTHEALASPAPTRLIALLRAGVGLDIRDGSGPTLAAHAMRQDDGAARGHAGDWTELLVEQGDPPPRSLGTWMLLWAASTGRLRLVERLLKVGIPVDAELNGELPRESIEEAERAFWWPGGTALHRLLANAERTHAPFFDESRIYSVAVLRLLTKSGASAGTVDAFGRTPLHIAARGALDAAVETLLTAPGLDLSRRDDSGQTALSKAVYRRASKQIALKLVSLGLPDDPAERARLLYRAAESRDEEVLRALLDAGCDPNAGTPDHPGALLALANDANHLASQVGAIPCLALLLERGADPDRRDQFGQTALHSFAYGKELEALDRLLEAGADADLADDRGRTPLMASRSTSIAQRLLAAGARQDLRDRYGYDALDHAIIYGRDEVAALFERPGRIARPEARLVRAVRNRDINSLNALLAAGVPADTVETDGSPVLNTAASTQVVEAMRALLDKGAPVDGRDPGGSTALDECLWSFRGGWEENLACTMLLLDRGASLDARPDVPGRRGDAAIFKGLSWWRMEPVATRVHSANQAARSHAGETSLMMAAKSGSAAQVALLLRKNIGVGEVDRSGLTALHYAADGPGREDEGEYPEKAELLIDAGAEIDALDGSGETPLFKAIRSGHERTFELLLERGADSARLNAKGESIATVALQTPHVWLFNRLLRLPADPAR